MSYYGAVRIDNTDFIDLSTHENLSGMDIWSAKVRGHNYYLATSDLTNPFYAGWYLALCDQPRVARTNCLREALEDLVELGILICYLVSMFPC
jgi:hypothetical protein